MAEEKNVKKNNNLMNALVLIVLVGIVAYFISKNLKTSSSILLSFVGLGVVIFIHEFGHFSAGKLCGIKVEAFAVGFGTIIFGLKKMENYLQIRILPTILQKDNDPDQLGLLCVRIPMNCSAGETEYQLRIFPLGGFVKLAGQEDLGADKKSDDPRSFTNVAIWKRIVAVSAGVTLNVILAGIIFVFVFMKGIDLPPAIVGGVIPGNPADKAGLKAGDEILAVNGRSNIDFSGVAFAAALAGKDQPVKMTVKKIDGKIEDINIVPANIPDMGIKGFGIEPPATLEIAKVQDPKVLKDQSGLEAGDVLTAVDGKKVEYFWQFYDILNDSFEPNMTLEFKRAGQDKLIEKKIGLQYAPTVIYVENGEFVPAQIYGLVPRIKIETVGQKKAALIRSILAKVSTTSDANGLEANDIIIQIGNVSNPTYKELREVTNANADKKLPIAVLRNGKVVDKVVTPKTDRDGRVVIGFVATIDVNSTIVAATTDANTFSWSNLLPRGAEIISIAGTDVKNYYDIAKVLNENQGKTVKVKYNHVLGKEEISFKVPNGGEPIQVKPQPTEMPPFKMMRKLYRASGPGDAIVMGSRKTIEFVGQTYMTLKGLITRDISPKSLMGPVGMIAASTKIISERDFMQYAYFMGMISACLAVMNFLPLPIFDGGLVVLLIIEKIKGSPVNEKVQEVLVYIGLVFILGLVVLVTYNDILRWIFPK